MYWTLFMKKVEFRDGFFSVDCLILETILKQFKEDC